MSDTIADNDFEATVCGAVKRYSLLSAGQTVVIAVSGGPDSTALLHLLASLREEWGLTLVAAHLNHGFRGAESDGDETYVADLCCALSVACVVAKADVPAMARRRHISAQEAARDVRHAFLKRVGAEHGATRIALGHTRDDRVETILLNMLRGTGPEGLAGFPALDPPLVRPLYDATRAQVVAYCARHGLSPRQDSSNAKTDYLRNRTRSELLPYLRSYYNQNADGALLRLAELVADDNEVLERSAAAFLAAEGSGVAPDSVILSRDRLSELSIALQRRVLRQAIAQIRGHLQNVGYDAVQGALDALARGERYMAMLPMTELGTVAVNCDANGLTVRLLPPPSSPVPWEKPLALPGATDLARVGIGISAVLCADGSELASLLRTAQFLNGAAYGDMQALVFRVDDVALPLTVRSWRPGDRIRLRRGGGSKKLQDLFVDRKIPVAHRARLAIVAAADGTILAVVGVAVSEWAIPRPEWESLRPEDGVAPLLVLIPYDLGAGMEDRMTASAS